MLPCARMIMGLELPEKIIKRIATGMNFSHHFVKIRAKLFYVGFFNCRNKNTRCMLLRDPSLLKFINTIVAQLLFLH